LEYQDYQLVSVDEQVEYGLRTPDGTVIWPPETYRGYPFSTNEERAAFQDILNAAAVELKLDIATFVGGFQWVPRSRTTLVVAKVYDQHLDIGHPWPVEPQEPTPEWVEDTGPPG